VALPPFVLSVVITVVLRYLNAAFGVKLVLAALFFGAGAWLTKSVTHKDIERMRQMMRGSRPVT
jgi:small basic protein